MEVDRNSSEILLASIRSATPDRWQQKFTWRLGYPLPGDLFVQFAAAVA